MFAITSNINFPCDLHGESLQLIAIILGSFRRFFTSYVHKHKQGKAEGLEPCLKAMDLLNSALGLHEDMRSGAKPVPLPHKDGASGAGGRGGRNSDAAGARDRRDGGVGGGGVGGQGRGVGPPSGSGGHRESEDLRDFLSTGGKGGGGGAGSHPPPGGDGDAAGASSAASLRLYQLPAVREACGGFDPARCIGEGGFGKVRVFLFLFVCRLGLGDLFGSGSEIVHGGWEGFESR